MLVERLKAFLSSISPKKEYNYHPYKFALVGEDLIETKEPVLKDNEANTQLSIDLDLPKQFSLTSSYCINGVDEINEIRSTTRGYTVAAPNKFKRKDTTLELKHFLDVGPFWRVEVIDIYNHQ